MNKLKSNLRQLIHGLNRRSLIFYRVLLAINVAVIILFFLQIYYPENTILRVLELIFGILFLVEYIVRLWVEPKKPAFVVAPLNLIDLTVTVSMFVPVLFGNLAFLRIIRSLRLLRSYRILKELDQKGNFISRNEDIVIGILNLTVFILITTAFVFVFQAGQNAQIGTYLDALYFTIATLTTTGFGDITPVGTSGKLLTILIMVFGISLFVNLVRSIFQPAKVIYSCPKCGLSRHDPDAVHCKHCGETLNIKTKGLI